MNWDRLLVSLVLVRIGQDLGSAGPLAQAVSALIQAVIDLPNGPASGTM